MKHFTLLLFCLTYTLSFAQTSQRYLLLENTLKGKTKRLNLEKAAYFTITRDSSDGQTDFSETYTSYTPDECAFGSERVIFKFGEYSSYENSYGADNSYRYREDYAELAADSTIQFNYGPENNRIDLYLTYQTKSRRALYSFGVGLFCTSLFSSVVVAPLVGMNNGSFKNYNWSRLWKFELYSGIGLAVSIPVSVLFLEKNYYFQTTSSYYPIWRVVDEE